ncbi:tonB-system energizer ExbB [Gallibacterium salpingitidis]|uniref:tonB-system energizer ExbB n=1 Tax=Gallibacterium salpingitidis TaxID=505341 RepID=UPI00266EF52F|nr:tonB-system energizer ExbB [Gallibacterium salpingitidis]WKS99848.1 tonB-system energizer ExbB [Gallibacterium salpingitidis]
MSNKYLTITLLALFFAVGSNVVAEQNSQQVSEQSMQMTQIAQPELNDKQMERQADISLDKQTPAEQEQSNLSDNQQTSLQEANLHDMSPLGMYMNAHWVVKIVMWILFVCSILTWLICIVKFIQFRVAISHLKKQQQWLMQQTNFSNTYQQLSKINKSNVSAKLISEINDELIKSNYQLDEDLKLRIDYRLERQIQHFGQQMRYGIAPLATIGAVAPFIGLFGTVWGIMNSFISIVNAKTTSLSVVAPGIAEALFATALGLVAAIPAVVIYNIFVRSINRYNIHISNLIAILRLMVKRDISLGRRLSTEG